MSDLMEYWGDVDVDSVEAARGVGGPIPVGEYMLALDSSEVKMTKDQTGVLLSCAFKVIEGEFEGRMIFSNMNIRNKNAQAQQIGIGEFKALCLATGIPFEVAKSDTTALMYAPFLARVGMEKPREGFEPRNQVKKYYPAGATAPAAPATAAKPATKPAAAPAAKPAGGGLPWKKTA